MVYANDLKIIRCIRSVGDCIELQDDLERFSQWGSINRICLKVTKCNAISFSKIHSPIPFNYNVNGTELDRVYNLKYLGIIFDFILSFNIHTEQMCNEAVNALGFIKRQTKKNSIVKITIFLEN